MTTVSPDVSLPRMPLKDTLPRPAADALDHIPGNYGWPLFGNTLQVLADPIGHVQRMHAQYGPIYRNRVFGFNSVSLLGPEANELVLFDRDRLFSSEAGWGPILDQLFPRGLMLMDFDEHRLHRKALSVAFKAGPMKSYLSALNVGISTRVAQWQHSQQGSAPFLFYPAIKQLTLDLAAASFLGIALGPEATTINRAFVDMVAASIGVVRQPIPGSKMYKGVRGRAVIMEYFSREIPARRTGDGQDIFSQLCKATHEDGSLLTTQDIVDHMSFLMMAAHDTLTSSVTSLIYNLAIAPQWQQKLREEAMDLKLGSGAGGKGSASLPYERLGDLALVEMAFKEAMRLNPPVPGIPRRAVRGFHFGGYDIPAGTPVSINPLFTHRMPEIWPDPLRFDPMRFTEEATRSRHKYAWVPYSGGAHMCLGLHFAYMQVKCFVYHLLTTTKVSVAPGYTPKWQMWPIPKPRDGLPVWLERI